MENPKYSFESTVFMSYEFVSEGPKGHITKLVKYTKDELTGLYNLGFGDKLGDEDDFDDKIVTNNGDTIKVLATVVATLYDFTNKYPNAIITAKGSTLSRTRFYRMGITNAFDEINKDFHVFGYLNGHWHNFERNQDYFAFSPARRLLFATSNRRALACTTAGLADICCLLHT